MSLGVEQLEPLSALPEECEEVYFGEMTDKEVERIASALHALNARGPEAPAESGKIKQTLGWHKGIGWTAICVTTLVFLFLCNWIFIVAPKDAKEDRRQERLEIGNQVRSAVAEGTGPLREKIAALTATLELLKPEAKRRLGAVMQENLRDRDLSLGLKTVELLAEKATQQRIIIDPRELVPVQSEVQNVVRNASVKDVLGATTALLNYRSSLNVRSVSVANLVPIPGITTKGPADDGYVYFALSASPEGPPAVPYTVDRAVVGKSSAEFFPRILEAFPTAGPKGIHDGSLIEPLAGRVGPFEHSPTEFTGGKRMVISTPPGVAIWLDGFRFRNVIFMDAEIRFDGKRGVKLENVQFINCTFFLRAESLATPFPQAIIAPGPLVQM